MRAVNINTCQVCYLEKKTQSDLKKTLNLKIFYLIFQVTGEIQLKSKLFFLFHKYELLMYSTSKLMMKFYAKETVYFTACNLFHVIVNKLLLKANGSNTGIDNRNLLYVSDENI